MARRNGQGGYLGPDAAVSADKPGRSAWRQPECAVRRRVTGKTRRTVYPCIDAGVNTPRNVLITARSVPAEEMKPGGVNGVHRALRFCSVFCPALRRVRHLAVGDIKPGLRGFGQGVDVSVKGNSGGISARNVYRFRRGLDWLGKGVVGVRIFLQGGSKYFQALADAVPVRASSLASQLPQVQRCSCGHR